MAFARARGHRHEFIIVEHLLLALLSNPSAREALEAYSVDLVAFRQELKAFIKQITPVLPTNKEERNTQPTLGFQRVLQRTIFHVQFSGHSEVTDANMLIAIFSEQESQAAYLLRKREVSRLGVVNFTSHSTHRDEPSQPSDSRNRPNNEEQAGGEGRMGNFTTSPNQLTRVGGIDLLIGQNKEPERVIQVLCRRREDNPLLVGESGAGKTAIAEGLAWRIVRGDVPEIMADCTPYSLDIGSLLAGTKYRGDFEKRFRALLKQLEQDTDSILFVDEIRIIIGAGAASGGQVDAANLIEPLLSSSKIRVIGSTAYQGFDSVSEKDRALACRFQKVDVIEPPAEKTVQIIDGLKPKYETHHDVRYIAKAVRTTVELVIKYINNRRLPDETIDAIGGAGARARLMPVSKCKKTINMAGIGSVVACVVRVPGKSVSQSDRGTLKNLGDRLKMPVFGQDKAIEALAEAIKMSRTGLGYEHKPVGSFLFAGPTGAGRTEVTVQLFKALGIELLRFGMSEYMECYAVSRLIDAPPRYVGLDQGGLLTDAIIKHPHAALLLDEIERTHPDVFNLLLQVMDNGMLTDSNGRKADFRDVVLVMTTNAGVRETERKSIGLIRQDNSVDTTGEIKKVFTPEFRNRLDNIIQFDHPSIEVVHQVIDKFIVGLQVRLDQKSVSLEVNQEAYDWLAEKSYDHAIGTRPMTRVVQDNLKKSLANELLFGSLVDGGQVTVALDREKSELTYGFRSTQKHKPEAAH